MTLTIKLPPTHERGWLGGLPTGRKCGDVDESMSDHGTTWFTRVLATSLESTYLVKDPSLVRVSMILVKSSSAPHMENQSFNSSLSRVPDLSESNRSKVWKWSKISIWIWNYKICKNVNQNRLLSQGFKIFETIKRYLAIDSIRGQNVESAFWTTIFHSGTGIPTLKRKSSNYVGIYSTALIL